MRFKVASLVEVSVKKKLPSWVWRCAEIVAVDRDGYMVRYYRRPGIAKEGVYKVAAEEVRPCPPPEVDSVIWIVGEIVEVLDDGYWKVSRIEADLGEGYYQIRVIGSIDEFRVKKASIRERREWTENNWVLMDQGSCECEDLVTGMRKKTPAQRQCDDCCLLPPESAFMSKSLKRPPSDNLSGRIKKQRALGEEDGLDAYPGDSYSFVGEVDLSARALGNNGKYRVTVHAKETTMIHNFNNKANDALKLHVRAADSVSNNSSVGSCFVIDAISDRVLSHPTAGCSQDNCSDCRDTEPLNPLGDEEVVSFKEVKREDALRKRDLDLRTYRCILETLYASGPLTWEQELSLTNLRMKCSVSNDEHLSELRRLKCIGGLGLSCY